MGFNSAFKGLKKFIWLAFLFKLFYSSYFFRYFGSSVAIFSSMFDLTIYLTIVVRYRKLFYNKHVIKRTCFVSSGMNTLVALCSLFTSRTMYFVQIIFIPKFSQKKKAWKTTSRLKCCWFFNNPMDVRRYRTSSSWRFCNCFADFDQLTADHLLKEFLTCLFKPFKPLEDVPMKYSLIYIKIVKQLRKFLILFYVSVKRHYLYSCSSKTKTQA